MIFYNRDYFFLKIYVVTPHLDQLLEARQIKIFAETADAISKYSKRNIFCVTL